MNILDFKESEFFYYETMQKVWGRETEITVIFEK